MKEENYALKCRLKSYIQPFERVLALRELGALATQEPISYQNGNTSEKNFFLEKPASEDFLKNRLAYWEEVRPASNGTGHHFTRQTRYEATGQLAKSKLDKGIFKEVLPFNGKLPKPNRRSLRYGSHGIHEYRGKFFPQLVRALLNIAHVPAHGIVLDPMCGSGTTLVEACMLGCMAYGLDMNPLSVLISQVKSNIFKVSPTHLEQLWDKFKTEMSVENTSGELYFNSVYPENFEYLKIWFHQKTLNELGRIMLAILKSESPIFSKFLKVALSNILRQVSWQKESDLRVRRDNSKNIPDNIMDIFLQEAESSFKSILALAYELSLDKMGKAQVRSGDASDLNTYPTEIVGKTDCIITSPPYATALPYLDTDRLSLYFFNMISRKEHRQMDYRMIGNREITQRLHTLYWNSFLKNKDLLSNETIDLVEKIAYLNGTNEVGFRRKNLPFLLAKYFLDMRKVMDSCFQMLKPGGTAFFVVGNNHTIAGGEKVEIPTDKLIRQLAEKSGFHWKESISMELLKSRDIFKKNAGSAETILCLQKL